MPNTLLEYLDTRIDSFQRQKRRWMVLSIFIVFLILFFAVEWRYILESTKWPVWIILSIFMSIISATWWYWTMSLVQKLLDGRKEEYKILREMLDDILEIKKDISSLRKG